MRKAAATVERLRIPLLVLAVSVVPVLGLFTTSRVFFVRDLSFFFWSRHLWLRHTIFSGQSPLWDPHVAGGQSAIADALNQIAMPLTLAVRLLPSDVVSFNLWVALPLPIAALGTYAFLRTRLDAAAAALGACIFTLSGPTISMLNAPNLSWSVALMPWVLWSAALHHSSGPAHTAVAFALQALCGEPVTWVTTGLLVTAMPLFDPPPGAARRIVSVGRTGAALAVGGLLAAMQLVPTFLAGVRAHRSAIATPDFWSLHPLGLWDALAPNLFGNYYDAFLGDLPWMAALNFGRDPFFYSLYVGPLVLLLAFVGAAGAWRRNVFWTVVLVVAVLAAMGGYTAFYPTLRKLVPQLTYFRFPVKYYVFAVFACAVLAAEGFAQRGRRDLLAPPLAVGALGLILSVAAFSMPETVIRAAHWLAASTHLKDPQAGAVFLARSAPPLALRACALVLGGVLLLSRMRHQRAFAAVLFALTLVDLAMINAPLNLTTDVAKLQPPPWYVASAGSRRLYIGGRARGYMDGNDPDGVKSWQIPAESTAIEGRMELNAQLPMMPSGWGVREALSYDLPYLWPAEYEATLRQFEAADAAGRDAFLRRSGVHRCVYPAARAAPIPAIADVSDWNMRVFECHPDASRALLASRASVATDPADAAWQRGGLFDLMMRDDDVRLAAMPAAAGSAGPPMPASVQITEDGAGAVTLVATAPAAAILVLRDSFDPSWSATVDGVPAGVVRANGIHRAVGIPPGRHVIRFTYRPRDFGAGLMISLVAAIALAAFQRFHAR